MQSFDSKNTDATDVADSRDATDAAVAVPVPFAIAVVFFFWLGQQISKYPLLNFVPVPNVTEGSEERSNALVRDVQQTGGGFESDSQVVHKLLHVSVQLSNYSWVLLLHYFCKLLPFCNLLIG